MTFVGVFVEDTEPAARDFLRAHPVSFPVGYDWDLAIAGPLGFRGMPYTVVVGRGGEVAHRLFGPVQAPVLAALIERVLTGA